ncbi:MAG: response regulator [Thermoplasmatota archaeon]
MVARRLTHTRSEDSLRRTVLVVDDTDGIAGAYADVARRLPGLHVRAIEERDPLRALERVRTHRFDLVLSDFHMPDIDGLTLLAEAARHHPEGRRVLMTGFNDMPFTRERLALARLDAFVQKPIRRLELLLAYTALLRADAASIALLREEARDIARRLPPSGAPVRRAAEDAVFLSSCVQPRLFM